MRTLGFNDEVLTVLDLEPDWEGGVRVELSTLVVTEVSLTNRETRRPMASTLRVSMRYRIVAAGADALRVSSGLRTLQEASVAVPFWPGACAWSRRSARPFGSGLSLARSLGGERVEVFGDSEPDWPTPNDQVLPLLFGYIARREPEWLNPSTMVLEVEFQEASPAARALVPAGADLEPGPLPGELWDSRPVLFPAVQHFERPRSGAVVDIEREEIGFGREPVQTLYPQANPRHCEVSCAVESGELARFVRFFADHAAGKAFWITEPNLAATLTSDTFDVDLGLNVAAGHAVEAGDFIALVQDSRQAFAKVTSVAPTTLTLLSPAGSFAAARTQVHQLVLARLDRARLSLEWRSPALATARVAIAELPPEYTPATGETLSQTLGVLPVRAHVYEIATRDDTGVVVTRATSFDRDLELGGFTYPSSPIEHRSLTRGLALDRDELELRFAPSPGDTSVPMHPLLALATLRTEAPVMVVVRELELLLTPDDMTNYTLLLNQSQAVDGSPVLVQEKRRFIAYLIGANVTVGATLQIEARMPDNAWAPIHAEGFTATGTKVLSWEGVFAAIRGRVIGYTDGTYTAYLVAAA